jgi:hypothetical protein
MPPTRVSSLVDDQGAARPCQPGRDDSRRARNPVRTWWFDGQLADREPRSTVDVDIAIKLGEEAGAALLERVNAEFYVAIDRARAAIQAHSSFNLIDTAHGLKVDTS